MKQLGPLASSYEPSAASSLPDETLEGVNGQLITFILHSDENQHSCFPTPYLTLHNPRNITQNRACGSKWKKKNKLPLLRRLFSLLFPVNQQGLHKVYKASRWTQPRSSHLAGSHFSVQHAHAHTHTHTYIHTQTHTCMCVLLCILEAYFHSLIPYLFPTCSPLPLLTFTLTATLYPLLI